MNLNATDQTFFDLITYSLSGNTYSGVNINPITLPTTLESWQYLHKLSASQKLWPVIFEVVSDNPEYLSLPQDLQNTWMMEIMAAIRQQVVQSEELASVCELLESENIRYVILKGVSCRRYYPNPDARPSGDEDILMDWRDYRKCDSL